MRDGIISLIRSIVLVTTLYCHPVLSYTPPLSLLSYTQVDMKISIGFIGVLMVLVAVVSSIGLLSYIGVMNTLIILEVVPFLVLAVGVDNFFILIHSYEVHYCRS